MRSPILLLFVIVTGCSSTQPFAGTPQDQAWFRHALSHPNEDHSYRQFFDAYHGNAPAVRSYFAEALKFCESSEIYAEPSESLSWTLQTLLHQLGDSRFAAILATEPPRNQSAVGDFLPNQALSAYPRTRTLLGSAPKIDFPLNKAYRG